MARRYIRLPAIQYKMGNCSASTVWRRVNDGTLPPPVKIGGLTVWVEDEVDARLGLADSDADDVTERNEASLRRAAFRSSRP